MHEMGIASSVLETVRKESRRGERASRVGVRIGEFVAVDPDSLRFCFEAIVKTSDLAPLSLEIEWCRAEGGRRGDELQIAYLEFEEVEVAT
jgi:Zn finger protein HypA/HybF involved in hydrogenase expression